MPSLLLGLAIGSLLTVRGIASWRTSRRRRRLVIRAGVALLDGTDDLFAIDRELIVEIAALTRRRRPRRARLRVDGDRALRQTQMRLRVLRAAVAIERADLATAKEELAQCEANAPGVGLVAQRLALIGGAGRDATPETCDALPDVLFDDTIAQIALAASDGATAVLTIDKSVLPSTRARALVGASKPEAARAILAALTPIRLNAIARLFPAEPIAREIARLRGDAAPYRS